MKPLFLIAGSSTSSVLAIRRPGEVTAVLENASFRTALESLLRSTDPLTYRVQGGIFTVSPRGSQTFVE